MGINLLIVEKNSSFLLKLHQYLQQKSFNIFESDGNSDLKKLLKQKQIDVVILDLDSYQSQGLLILKQIKKCQPHTEVILINTSEQLSLSIEGMKLGAFDDFFMPVHIQTLINRIQDAYHKKQQHVKSKKSLFQIYQDMMVGVTFAEAGEAEIAQSFIRQKNRSHQQYPDKKINHQGENHE